MDEKRKFRLQKVLEVREIVEKDKIKALSAANRKLQLEKQRMKKLKETIHSIAAEINRVQAANVHRMSNHHDHLKTLLQEVYEQRHVIFTLQQEVEKKRSELLQATKDKKVLQTLKEKTLVALQAEEKKREQNALDELALRHEKTKLDRVL